MAYRNLSSWVMPFVLTACATQSMQAPVPANLVPAGERPVERLSARGVQTYECLAKPGATSNAIWNYVAAELELFDTRGNQVGRHTFPPPVWESPDGSKFMGNIKACANAPRPDAAPWLLVSAKSTSGEGRFSRITSVQRINTVGGVAPPTSCDAKTIGATERVPFTADYVLFSR